MSRLISPVSLDFNKTVVDQSPFHRTQTISEVSRDGTRSYSLPIDCGNMSDISDCNLTLGHTSELLVQEKGKVIAITREQNDFDTSQSVRDERYASDDKQLNFYSEDSTHSIYPCGICRRVCNGGLTIQCESGCYSWFHKVCTGLTDAAFMLLTGEDFAEWICDKCISTKNVPFIKVKS